MSNENNAMFNRIAMIGIGDIGLPTAAISRRRWAGVDFELVYKHMDFPTNTFMVSAAGSPHRRNVR